MPSTGMAAIVPDAEIDDDRPPGAEFRKSALDRDVSAGPNGAADAALTLSITYDLQPRLDAVQLPSCKVIAKRAFSRYTVQIS